MDAYRLKNYVWMVIILMYTLIFLLAGCSSTPYVRPQEQFCDLKTETVVDKDNAGRIINQHTREVMKCNDNKIDRIAIKQAGIAQNCGEYEYYITLGGKAVAQHGMACKRFDGHWEVLSE
jgi:hypothetical protein